MSSSHPFKRNSVSPRYKAVALSITILLILQSLALFPVYANNTPQTPNPPFQQNWTNTGLINANDDWSGVPGIVGFLGDYTGSSPTGVDPQTLLQDMTTVDVIANQNGATAPNTLANGGVAEFDGIANPTIALNGSGTADAPNVVFYLNTTGLENINVAYDLRDLDGSADDAVQQVALQYRVGGTGNFTNVPAGYVNDATTGPSLATKVTAVNVTLPAAVNDKPVVQVRVMTTNAAGNDEWVGVDNIVVSGTVISNSTNPTGTGNANPSTVAAGDTTLLTVAVTPGTNPTSTAHTVSADLSSIDGSASQQFFDDGSNGDVTPNDNVFSFSATVGNGASGGPKTLPVIITETAPNSRTGSATISLTVLAPTNPSGTGSANPNSVPAGNMTLLTVNVTPGANPTSSGINVTADLTAIGGSATQAFTDNGGNTFTYSATVAPATTPGAKSLPVSITDGQGRSGSTSIALTVAPPPPNHVVISQIYGGGGNSGAVYNRDYVELYNPHTQSFDLTGWSLQYASSTGDGWEFTRQPLGGSIGPGEYYLISLASGGAPGAPLPAANISGDINMSGTTGKIALVSNFDPLEGSCPISDPDLVDFVGYGSSANCSETTNAPAPSNTNAIFRKSDGATDTDNNGADFITGAPNPRRTAPIVEIGPSVFGTDPRNNASSAPRDASITVTFTEPVDVVEGAWFDITCVNTGQHNDATFSGGGKSHVITPNVNFQAGEQCTVTIFKDFVHDQDLDDSGTNSDTMAADYTWTFTVATGTAPPYPPSVHLTMGNPNDATADINQPNNYLMEKPEFALSYNRDKGTPNWVSWHLSDEWIGSLARNDTFRADPAVPSEWYRVQGTDYSGSGFDRGHMVPNADRDKETSIPINQATFLMTNIIPQAPDNNQGPWANMEGYLRTLLPANELYIVAGGAGTGGTGSSGAATTIANGHVAVPAQTWKVALVIPKDSGDDVSRVTCGARTIAVIMPNTQGIRNDNWENYIVTVDQVEALTGYDFYSNLPDAVENCVEAGTNGVNPPGTASQSVTTEEDTPVAITLEAASPNSNPLTYTIVSGPSHGTLTGSDADRVYTPAAEFKGTDSFTFKVNDGSSDSNTSTVTITVTEVNDAPVTADDNKSTAEDTPLSFPASDLTTNDNAGAPDESGQTLTVSAVNAGPDTHGTVTLDAGQVTYTPEANYHGPASFTYTVCDNGSPSAQCSPGTVNVTVGSTNDAPIADAGADQTVECGGEVTLVGSGFDPEGDELTYEWREGTTILGTSATLNTTLGFGSHTITLKVTDTSGASGEDTVVVNVIDTVAPTLTSNGQTISIWPPNKKYHTFSVANFVQSASDSCDASVNLNSVVIAKVTSDEGSLSNNDIIIGANCKSVQLRADRNGNGDGRVYTITFRVRDAAGNTTTLTRQVKVPHGNGGNAIDSGVAYTVTSGCP